MSQEEQGFEIKDRRMFNEDGSLREGEHSEGQQEEASASAAPPAYEPPPEAAPDDAQRSSSARRVLPPVDFNSFIISLGHAVMAQLGQIPDHTGQTHLNLDLARHTIDTITMLREKTMGNLTAEEQGLIDNVLSELRLAYVQAKR